MGGKNIPAALFHPVRKTKKRQWVDRKDRFLAWVGSDGNNSAEKVAFSFFSFFFFNLFLYFLEALYLK